jgi:nicotinic acid mononucleotide adenylyltransferase
VTVGAYPGSFNPPTVAHLAIAEAALRALGLRRIDFVVSRVALGKEQVAVPSLADRVAVLEAVASSRPWLGVQVTDEQLLADVAAGYDALVLGADKWAQVVDDSWYESPVARDEALRRLPPVLVVPRPPFPLPVQNPPRVSVLDLGDAHVDVSSTKARGGRSEWMLPEAARFDAGTGAWSNPTRYLAERRVPPDRGR